MVLIEEVEQKMEATRDRILLKLSHLLNNRDLKHIVLGLKVLNICLFQGDILFPKRQREVCFLKALQPLKNYHFT